MFGRRHAPPILELLLRYLWPRGGWRRQGLYVAHRLKRLPGSPNRIAAGFACGVAVSFTPFIGFHFLLAALMALIMRANIVASAIGTVAGNPWTFPVIWIWTYEIGTWIQGIEGGDTAPRQFSMQYIFDNPMDVLWPMAIGSVPTGVAAWLLTFLLMRIAVQRYQLRRRRSLHRRLRRRRFRERLKRENEAVLGKAEEAAAEVSLVSEDQLPGTTSLARQAAKR